MSTISLVTDKIIFQGQRRPLEAMYLFVWLDAIHYKIKEDGRYVSKAVYTILGVNLKGRKEVLGLYISENGGANFWLQVLTDLQNSLMKLFYMGIQNASKKWTMPVWKCSLTISRLAIFFEGRLDKYLEV